MLNQANPVSRTAEYRRLRMISYHVLLFLYYTAVFVVAAVVAVVAAAAVVVVVVVLVVVVLVVVVVVPAAAGHHVTTLAPGRTARRADPPRGTASLCRVAQCGTRGSGCAHVV